jgi:hypothetical protein
MGREAGRLHVLLFIAVFLAAWPLFLLHPLSIVILSDPSSDGEAKNLLIIFCLKQNKYSAINEIYNIFVMK